jgi:uncharacterized membrane protein YhaH (DUF805 family)
MNYYTDALKKYAVFSGRASRKQYWMFVLFNLIVSIIVGIIGYIIDMTTIGNLYALAVLIPGIAIGVRRLHDIGRTGWWVLLSLIPIIGWIVLLVFSVQDSQAGDNQYGSNPKIAAAAMASTQSTPPTPPTPSAPSTPVMPQ